MLTAERRQHLLDTLRRDGKVLASEMSVALNVSEDTIRRDLRELAEAGLLVRVHGGALPTSPADLSHALRQRQSPTAKAVIADAAIQLVRNGQVILLDGGTTTLQVAERLPHHLRATVVTHAPAIVMALIDHPSIEMILLGGQIHKKALVGIGTATVEALQSIRADVCMLGVCCLHPEIGISNINYEEVHIKRAMIHSAAEVVALAAAEKIGTAAPYIIGPISELTHLVTERSVSDDALAAYRALGVTTIRAG